MDMPVTNKDSTKPFVCGISGCSSSFVNDDHLSAHKITEHKVKLDPLRMLTIAGAIADQTPTPSKLLPPDALGIDTPVLFPQLKSHNPFADAFKHATLPVTIASGEHSIDALCLNAPVLQPVLSTEIRDKKSSPLDTLAEAAVTVSRSSSQNRGDEIQRSSNSNICNGTQATSISQTSHVESLPTEQAISLAKLAAGPTVITNGVSSSTSHQVVSNAPHLRNLITEAESPGALADESLDLRSPLKLQKEQQELEAIRREENTKHHDNRPPKSDAPTETSEPSNTRFINKALQKFLESRKQSAKDPASANRPAPTLTIPSYANSPSDAVDQALLAQTLDAASCNVNIPVIKNLIARTSGANRGLNESCPFDSAALDILQNPAVQRFISMASPSIHFGSSPTTTEITQKLFPTSPAVSHGSLAQDRPSVLEPAIAVAANPVTQAQSPPYEAAASRRLPVSLTTHSVSSFPADETGNLVATRSPADPGIDMQRLFSFINEESRRTNKTILNNNNRSRHSNDSKQNDDASSNLPVHLRLPPGLDNQDDDLRPPKLLKLDDPEPGMERSANEKLADLRERNRLAAARSRERKKKFMDDLQRQCNECMQRNTQLQNEITCLQTEVSQLKAILLSHKHCPLFLQQLSNSLATYEAESLGSQLSANSETYGSGSSEGLPGGETTVRYEDQHVSTSNNQFVTPDIASSRPNTEQIASSAPVPAPTPATVSRSGGNFAPVNSAASSSVASFSIPAPPALAPEVVQAFLHNSLRSAGVIDLK